MTNLIHGIYSAHPVLFWIVVAGGLVSPRAFVCLFILYAVFIVLFK